MSEFVEFLHEVFASFGRLQARRMFGGYGLYHEGVMFGLVADEVLYLKADSTNMHYFTEQQLPPFQYHRGERVVSLSYFQAPDAIYDDQELAALWARRSYDVAYRGRRPSKTIKPAKTIKPV